jgi:hypothetical protein
VPALRAAAVAEHLGRFFSWQGAEIISRLRHQPEMSEQILIIARER